MCGIAGAVALSEIKLSVECLSMQAARMTASILHRGPDGGGLWASPDGAVALAHRRLAIVDLSEQGRQPMSYASGRFHITFNGEIYNFRELAGELEKAGCTFRSSSDTEVLLAAVAEWGLESALLRISGMFAFALWDAQERVLHLARDRLGEKPLYFSELNSYLYFASELRAVATVPGIDSRLSDVATAAYLRDGYVPEPLSIYHNVWKLPPGSSLSVPASRGKRLDLEFWKSTTGDTPSHSELRPKTYWDLASVASNATSDLITDPSEACEEFERRLREATRRQMRCDVPLGAFLSGGIDSSLVAAVMQAETMSPVRTFTVAFDKPEFDEAPYARGVAAHLGTDHEEILLSEEEVVGCVPETVSAMDEPTANGSFFPVYLISKCARQRVKVVLSGDGGDELFAGYNRYALTERSWHRIGAMPPLVRSLLRKLAEIPNHRSVDRYGSALTRLLPMGSQVSLSSAFAKGVRILGANSLEECYALITSCWPSSPLIRSGGVELPPRVWNRNLASDLSRMLAADQLAYLPGDNLAKVDRASMAVSLETRLPLLDHRVVEFSWQLSDGLKLRNGVSKFLMRSLLERFVPNHLTERKKMGFSVPTDQWLLGPLREWAGDMLSAEAFKFHVPLAHDAVMPAWHSYLERKQPSDYQMWSVVMLAAWMESRTRMQPAVEAGSASDMSSERISMIGGGL